MYNVGRGEAGKYKTSIHAIFGTDHKPLVQILQSKNLDTLTPRL